MPYKLKKIEIKWLIFHFSEGDSYTKEMEVETIIAEEKSDSIGESGKEKDVEKIDEISVKNEEVIHL